MESINLKSKKIFCKIIDAMKGERHLKIKNGEYLPLTIELLDQGISTLFGTGNIYSLCQYYEQNGDLMQSPEMCFIAVDNRPDKSQDWEQVVILPFMFRVAALCIYEISISIEGEKMARVNKELQLKHALLADQWLYEIQTLGFLKNLQDGNEI